MSSRNKILKEVAQNKPAALPLPEMFFPEDSTGKPADQFLSVLHSIGGVGKVVNGWHEVQQYLQQVLQEGKEIVNGIRELSPINAEMYVAKTASELQNVHAVFLQGELAVAENAAIWLPEANMVNRSLPFICEHLVLVIQESEIVTAMHQAYAKVDVDRDGYGVFIAGPSKTADIEQSLVIGAHGPLSLQVFILAA
jgi:L-lactate dehydrogenase complex protein LldG